MPTECKPLKVCRIYWAALILGLIFGGTFFTGCDRPTPSDAPTASSPSGIESSSIGVVLRAEPNPITTGNPDGTTTITWDTGSDDVGEVYVMEADKEKLFASGAKGSQEATWIKPGSTEFRLYTKADHKLLSQIKVTMSPPGVPPSDL